MNPNIKNGTETLEQFLFRIVISILPISISAKRNTLRASSVVTWGMFPTKTWRLSSYRRNSRSLSRWYPSPLGCFHSPNSSVESRDGARLSDHRSPFSPKEVFNLIQLHTKRKYLKGILPRSWSRLL
jgi:hypothetical protein